MAAAGTTAPAAAPKVVRRHNRVASYRIQVRVGTLTTRIVVAALCLGAYWGEFVH